jgi:hypothetical protein
MNRPASLPNPVKKERIPLKLSTRRVVHGDPKENSTMFTVMAALRCAGFTLADVQRWGGKIQLAMRPSHPLRRASIANGAINAIFDEGLKSWGQTALDNGFRYLPVDGEVLKKLAAMGYRTAMMSSSGFTA